MAATVPERKTRVFTLIPHLRNQRHQCRYELWGLEADDTTYFHTTGEGSTPTREGQP